MAVEKKSRELYQLVAISKGVETVIELKNDNKNNKGTLELIDSGTSYFNDRDHLARYLLLNKKITDFNSTFAIKYNHNGVKYMPVIYADSDIRAITRDRKKYYDYMFLFLKKIEICLNDPGFLRYIIEVNNKTKGKYESGNYINQRLLNAMIEYYNVYVVSYETESNRVELQYDIATELHQYKQLRTLRDYYIKYFGYDSFTIGSDKPSKNIR